MMNKMSVLVKSGFFSTYRDSATVIFSFLFPTAILYVFSLIALTMPASSSSAYIEGLVPAVMAFGIGFSACFAAANTLRSWRQDDVLRVLWLMPVSPFTIAFSRLIVAMVTAIGQTLLLLVCAVYGGLHFTPSAHWWLFLFALCFGVPAFFSIGLIIGNWVDSQELLTTLMNILFIFMGVLSGVFFPLTEAPKWLVQVSNFIPLTYLRKLLEAAVSTGTELSTRQIEFAALLLIGIAIVFFCIIAKTLRWIKKR
jgi:ABC-2 type transport system permease protein